LKTAPIERLVLAVLGGVVFLLSLVQVAAVGLRTTRCSAQTQQAAHTLDLETLECAA
jgi:hypothetical protein